MNIDTMRTQPDPRENMRKIIVSQGASFGELLARNDAKVAPQYRADSQRVSLERIKQVGSNSKLTQQDKEVFEAAAMRAYEETGRSLGLPSLPRQ